jgi:hypothetical protein
MPGCYNKKLAKFTNQHIPNVHKYISQYMAVQNKTHSSRFQVIETHILGVCQEHAKTVNVNTPENINIFDSHLLH